MRSFYPLKLVASLLLCLISGGVGSLFTYPSIPNWYASLNKPSFTPPNWVFGPVWTLLYIFMGISLYLIWVSSKKKKKNRAYGFFLIQLLLNFLWSIIFFGFRLPSAALIDIILLWVCIVLTMVEFNKISKASFWLLIPYILWVTYASVLNFYVILLNK